MSGEQEASMVHGGRDGFETLSDTCQAPETSARCIHDDEKSPRKRFGVD